MKNKIYIVQESIGVMGELRQQMVRAFACKRTAKKFIEYKNLKLAELKTKFEDFDPQIMGINSSTKAESKLKRFVEVHSRNEYFLQEVDMHC